MLAAWLVAISLDKYAVFLGAVIIAWQILKTGKLQLSGLYVTRPVLLLIIIGAISGGFELRFTFWDYMRDAILLLRVPLIAIVSALIVGNQMSERNFARAIVMAGTFLAAVYLIRYMGMGGDELTRRALQTGVGRGYVLAVFAIFTLLFGPNLRCVSFTSILFKTGLSAMLMYSVVASTSRTLLLLLAYFFVAKVWIALRAPFGFLLSIVVGVVAILSFPPVLEGIGRFVDSLGNPQLSSFIGELVASDFGSFSQINDAYRAFEASRGWETFINGSSWSYLFGQGLGARVDLGVSVVLGAQSANLTSYTTVPFGHVAGVTALVKFGVIGFLIYFWTLFTLSWLGPTSRKPFFSVINHGSIILLAHIFLTFQGLFSTLNLFTATLALASASTTLLHADAKQSKLATEPATGQPCKNTTKALSHA